MTANNPHLLIPEQYYANNICSTLMGTDESLQADWKIFFESLNKLGPEETENRRLEIFRLLRENGVTYNIYGDPSGLNRPWNLDIIPFLLSQKDWARAESGLAQRAQLLDLILKDIYGEGRLIKNGILPAEIIYNHSGFLRPCVGIQPVSHRVLVLYAADMARSADGKLWVLNDRTQAPSGAGYALENRIAMARILPELFNGLPVRHLSFYFDTLRNYLLETAPVKKQDTRVVILTPGSANETYFEHSYLSSYLGFTLVQGDDLMVMDNYVWLKTLGGLEKVDVILRRVDDVFCDPLELKDDSRLGVPGLLQAVRSGNVSVANPLGSGILENPGLMPFLHSAARYFLNEDLILSSIASWWCGQEKERNFVLENLPTLVIKKIHKGINASTSIDGASLSTAALQQLREQIKAQPYLYVGQEKLAISSTPSLVDASIQPRNGFFRTFLVGGADGYTAMPGGLTRTAKEENKFVISNQLGSISKDTWVIAPEPGEASQYRINTVEARMAEKGDLTSRTAENLFWVGRNAERVLANARFIRNVLQSSTEGNRHHQNELEAERYLLEAITHCTATYPGFADEDKNAVEQKFKHPWIELKDVLFDENKPGSLIYNFRFFCRGVYSERDHWSTDTWRVIWNMEKDMEENSLRTINHIKAITVLDNLITSLVAFIGLNRESISREQGWVMLDTGRKLEQSLMLISMLRHTMVQRYDDSVSYSLYEALLKSNEALVNYRYKYRRSLQHLLVLELMLQDVNNPRSLIYQLDRLKVYLSSLPKTNRHSSLLLHEKLILEAHTLLRLVDKEQFMVLDEKKEYYSGLDAFLEKLYNLLCDITPALSKTYFKHYRRQKQLFIAEPY